MKFNDREEIIALTPQWKGERLPDGRPYVDAKYLKALETLTLEEVWKPIFVKGYESQFEGRLHTLHDDGRKLIGRAVTATYCPFRPDLDEVVKETGKSENRTGTYNQWIIDNLMEGDVPVIDMYDKIYKGTYLGGNLTTALKNKTKNKNGGAVYKESEGYYWSSKTSGSTSAYRLYLDSDEAYAYAAYTSAKIMSHAVRCVQE